ncbi:MAG: response regulator [Anaerolineales bacterium]
MTIRILLIEDNPDHALLVETALEAMTPVPELQLIDDGQQALELIQSTFGSLPDLVLLDLKLPKVDGLEVLRTIRAAARWQAVPVMVLTTSNRPADVEACVANGATAYLSKITDLSRLSERITILFSTAIG